VADKGKNRDTDHIYGVSRIRALENSIAGNEKCSRLAEAKDLSDLKRMFEEMGLREGSDNFESSLSALVSEAFALAEASAPGVDAARIQRYFYDCHNIKAALKASLAGKDGSELCFDFGTVPVRDILKMASEREFSKLPENMSKAVPAALESYNRTKDPQFIDVITDKACYRDMETAAEASGIGFLERYVAKKADVTNILIAVRFFRMGEIPTAETLRRIFVPGGSIDADKLISIVQTGDEDSLSAYLSLTDLSDIGAALASKPSLAAAEKVCEDHLMSFLGETKYQIGGAEVFTAYIAARECESKNLRIILAGKAAELGADTIKERLRANYV